MSTRPSSALLSAAVAALAVASGCGPGAHSHGASSKITKSYTDPTITVASFSADCKARGGYVQTHATCFGNNSCSGISYNKFSYEVTEHTCSASNGCGGMSCVDLPADRGRSGEAIFANEGCSSCHQYNLQPNQFQLFYRVGEVPAPAAFLMTPVSVQEMRVAFGSHGINESGTAFANMAENRMTLSRPEIERVVQYVRTLEPVPLGYGILGETEDTGPDAN